MKKGLIFALFVLMQIPIKTNAMSSLRRWAATAVTAASRYISTVSGQVSTSVKLVSPRLKTTAVGVGLCAALYPKELMATHCHDCSEHEKICGEFHKEVFDKAQVKIIRSSDIGYAERNQLISEAVKMQKRQTGSLYGACVSYINDPEPEHIFIVYKDKVIGYLRLYKEKCYIGSLIIDERYRCNGLGSMLLEAAAQEAKLSKCQQISLVALESNRVARSLYGKHNYSCTTTGLRMTKPL